MSPELRAMLNEQEWYNRQLNGMLEVPAFCKPRDMEELTLWMDGTELREPPTAIEGSQLLREEERCR